MTRSPLTLRRSYLPGTVIPRGYLHFLWVTEGLMAHGSLRIRLASQLTGL